MKEDGSSEIVTVTRNEGTVSEEGDAFDADTMNNLEERIDAGFAELNGKLNEYPSKLSQDYTTDNESHTFPIGALSLFFITYGTNNQADVYLCRCVTANAHALAPLHTSSVIAQTYEIKLDIATRSVTITSKRPWVRVDIINL